MTQTFATTLYPIVFREDARTDTGEPCWVAEDPGLPGAIGYGDDRDAASAMLAKSRAALLRHLARTGAEIPFRAYETDLIVHSQAMRVLA